MTCDKHEERDATEEVRVWEDEDSNSVQYIVCTECADAIVKEAQCAGHSYACEDLT